MPLTVLSLGAGVQSSTLALMAAHGEITPMPACAIFADTGWEPPKGYDWLNYLEKQLHRAFPVHRVMKGDIRADALESGRSASMPWTTLNPDGSTGRIRRQCTAEYKIQPIERKLRELIGLVPHQRAPKEICIEQWIGISMDEAHRMKPYHKPWARNRFPLVENHISRGQCIEWMLAHDYPQPPRSACIGCPYHSNDEWRRIKAEAPKDWIDAVAFDTAIRKSGGLESEIYTHREARPLAEIDFRNAADMGQNDLFGEECEGMCGV